MNCLLAPFCSKPLNVSNFTWIKPEVLFLASRGPQMHQGVPTWGPPGPFPGHSVLLPWEAPWCSLRCPGHQSHKESACQCRRHGLGTSSGEGNGNPHHYSCLGNPMGITSAQAEVPVPVGRARGSGGEAPSPRSWRPDFPGAAREAP